MDAPTHTTTTAPPFKITNKGFLKHGLDQEPHLFQDLVTKKI